MLKVTRESKTGLNTHFRDTKSGQNLTRRQCADLVSKGQYPGYHVRHVNKKRIVASNPDNKKYNNLG